MRAETPLRALAEAPAAGPAGWAERPRRPRRLSAGTLVPAVLAVLAGGSVYAALSQRGATIRVAVAATTLPAGTVLSPSDVRAVEVSAAAGVLTRAVFSPADVPYGWVTAVGVGAGDPLTPDVIAVPVRGAGAGQMSIPLPEAQAAGGTLVAGDEVDMILASPRRSRYVATGLRVVGTSGSSPGAGLLSGSGPGYDVVVQVSRASALEVATALATASGTSADQVELVRSQPTAGLAGRAGRGAPPGGTGAGRD